MDFHELERLRRKREFYAHDAPGWVRTIWPRPQSFDNFCKEHRTALKASGAMRRVGRDYFLDREVFPQVAANLLGLNILPAAETRERVLGAFAGAIAPTTRQGGGK